MTGRTSGPHVHWEVRVKGPNGQWTHIDRLAIVSESAIAGGVSPPAPTAPEPGWPTPSPGATWTAAPDWRTVPVHGLGNVDARLVLLATLGATGILLATR